MDDSYKLGIYVYKSKIDFEKYNKLPQELNISKKSPICLLLELVMGNIFVLSHDNKILYRGKDDYTKLPINKKDNNVYNQFKTVLGINDFEDETVQICNKFFKRERKNAFVYQHVLNEITQFLVCNKKTPCEGFLHLYRALEFMGYSFPLIYATQSRNFKGSYDSLRKFFREENKNISELEFFRNFLKLLYSDSEFEYNYKFEACIYSNNFNELKMEFLKCINSNHFNFEDQILQIEFKYMGNILADLRNKYFHMSIGQKQNNFYSMGYDKNDLFNAINPIFANWLICVFVKIIQNGIMEYSV